MGRRQMYGKAAVKLLCALLCSALLCSAFVVDHLPQLAPHFWNLMSRKISPTKLAYVAAAEIA